MFAVYCKGHGHTLLLSTDDIESIVNGSDGIAVHWRCDQGHRGCWRPARPDASRRLLAA